jgi:hypothetical protein
MIEAEFYKVICTVCAYMYQGIIRVQIRGQSTAANNTDKI